MITVRHLEFGYPSGKFHLNIPDFRIPAGRSVALTGSSGTGKTTLLNIIAGILTPDIGTVEVSGSRIDRLSEARRRAYRLSQIGFVFQDFGLLPYLSVLNNILLPARLGGISVSESGLRERAEDLAESVGLTAKLAQRPGKLSTGEIQRTAICRALIARPRLILADEATGNLDPDNRDLIWSILDDFRTQNDAVLLAVTHDHDVLDRFEDHVDMKDLAG